MSTPPSPGLPPALLALLARLVWQVRPDAFDSAGLALGSFGSTGLYVTVGELWASGPAPATSPALGPFLFTEGTANVIQHGAPQTDGSIVYNGQRYRVQAILDNGSAVARAVMVS